MLPKNLLLVCLLFACFFSFAQSKIDSLESKLRSLSLQDTLRVKTLNNLVEHYEFVDSTKAWKYCRESIETSVRLKYAFGHAEALRLAGILCTDVTDFAKARTYFLEALTRYEGTGNQKMKRGLANTRHWLGITYDNEGDYEAAVVEYLKAAKSFEESKNIELTFYSYLALMGIKITEKDYKEGLKYAQECLTIAKKLKIDRLLAHAYMGVASVNTMLKNYELSLHYLDTAKTISEEVADKRFLSRTYYLKAEVYNELDNGREAIENYSIAIDHLRRTNDKFQLAGILQELGECYLKYGKLDESEKTLKESLTMARQFELKDVERVTYKNLSELSEKKGRQGQALLYVKEYLKLNDSIMTEENQKRMKMLEGKFNTERKENQIVQLEKDKQIQGLQLQQKNNLNIALAGAIIILLLSGALLYRVYAQNKQLQQQRIHELETEKQLLASEAVLRGQEVERTRMAKDLHDGLGGILSGIKYTFNTMKVNLVMTPENQSTFERGIDMLDDSIKELRRVAHNMMPESLVKFGLTTAVKDFCADIQGGGLNVTYQPVNMEGATFADNVSIGSFRILQELVNNVLKHSNASSILVQLSYDNKQLVFTVEDDGKGLDPSKLSDAKGMGWSNIYSRVDYLKGNVDIQSAPGKGTSVTVTIPC